MYCAASGMEISSPQVLSVPTISTITVVYTLKDSYSRYAIHLIKISTGMRLCRLEVSSSSPYRPTFIIKSMIKLSLIPGSTVLIEVLRLSAPLGHDIWNDAPPRTKKKKAMTGFSSLSWESGFQGSEAWNMLLPML